MSETKVYIRVQRQNQTICLLCSPQDSVRDIKRQIVAAVQQHAETETAQKMTPSDMLLLLPENKGPPSNNKMSRREDGDTTMKEDGKTNLLPTALTDEDTIGGLGLKDNDAVHVVFAISDSEWEPVEVIPTDLSSGGWQGS